MAVSTKITDMTGNQNMVDGQTFAYDTILNTNIPSANRPVMVVGTGVPTGVLTAPKGSVYVDITAAGANLRMYINTNGTTGWGAVTSA